MANASSTMYTYLGYRTAGTTTAFTKLCSIKDYPDLGGAPDQIDITDLDDDVQKFILGVQSMSTLEFLANYDKDTYETISGLSDGTMYEFCVSFGKNPTAPKEYGMFTWEGQLAVWVVGGGVNAAREMRISISATTKVVKAGSTTTFSTTAYEPTL